MTARKVQLVVGRFYDYWVKLPPVPPVHHTNGKRSHGMPAMKAGRTGQLIDKRSNGVLVMQVDYVTWDYPHGWASADAPAYMLGDKKRPVTKTRLEKVKAHQVTGLAKEQPARRVPNPPKEAA